MDERCIDVHIYFSESRHGGLWVLECLPDGQVGCENRESGVGERVGPFADRGVEAPERMQQ